MTKTKYSIVIPAFNAALYIDKCLDSILNQNYQDFEVIIVNDGSTDETLKIVNDYTRSYSNVIVLSQDNAGPGAARELGVKHASGNYIMFSDADDYWDSNFLAGIDVCIEKWGPDILEFGYRKVDLNGEIISNHPMIHTQYTNANCVEYYVDQRNTTNYLCNKVFSAKMFQGVHFPHLYAGEDAAVLLQLFVNARSYVSVSDIYYNYVMSPKSLCRAPFNIKKLDVVKSDDFMYDYLSKVRPDLCDKLAYAISARNAVLYCELMLSEVEEKEQIGAILKQRYKKYRSCAGNSRKVSESYSVQRKGIVFLFGITPNMCVLIYLLIRGRGNRIGSNHILKFFKA